MKSLVFASDSFKGTLSSARIAEILCEEARSLDSNVRCTPLMIADGGEGTVDAVLSSVGGQHIKVTVAGPDGRPVDAHYGLLDKDRAVIEMAQASGLTLVPIGSRNPELASSRGFGELILDALDRGVSEIYLGLGGSATNDGGMGAMAVLGARFLDPNGMSLAGSGADLMRVERIEICDMDPRIAKTKFIVMSDVVNPLVGASGSTRVFGKQKGASLEMLDRLEAGMRSYASVIDRTFGWAVARERGAGAAGGMGAACLAFLSAQMMSGIDCLLDLMGFDEILASCDLCISGEGHADAQSLGGKVLSGIAKRCRKAQVPLVAIVGGMDREAEALLEVGVSKLISCFDGGIPFSYIVAHAEGRYRECAREVLAAYLKGGEINAVG